MIRLSLDLDRRPHMSFSVRIAAIRRAAVSAGLVQGLERAPDDPAAVICIEIVEAGPEPAISGSGAGSPVAALPCPSPHHRAVVRAFSANGARGVGRMRPQVGLVNLPLGKCPLEASGSGNAAAEAEAPSLTPCSGQRRAAWGQARRVAINIWIVVK